MPKKSAYRAPRICRICNQDGHDARTCNVNPATQKPSKLSARAREILARTKAARSA